jgi:hypothetical protein
MDGVYGFAYCGDIGVGMGALEFSAGKITGQDIAGGVYRGDFTVDPGTGDITLKLELTVPAGMPLVQGTSAQPMQYAKTLTAKLPADFADGTPFDADVPPGKVKIMAKRIPDDWSRFAQGQVKVSFT